MSWVRLDDLMPEHPKVLRVGPAAAWLHVCALAYCTRHLTDGFVPAPKLAGLADLPDAAAEAARLVDVGMWEPVDGGWAIHDFLEYQPSADEVRSRREAQSKAGRAGARARWQTDGEPDGEPHGRSHGEGDGKPHADRNGDRTETQMAPYPYPNPTTEQAPNGARSESARTRTVDQEHLPDGLAPHLIRLAPDVLEVLARCHGQRGGQVPTLRGVGLALLAFPRRDHMAIVRDLEHWSTAGRGQRRAIKDWVATYRSFLKREPDSDALSGRGLRTTADVLRVLEGGAA